MKNMESGDLPEVDGRHGQGELRAADGSKAFRLIAWSFPVFYSFSLILVWSAFALPLRTFELVTGVLVGYEEIASLATILFFPCSVAIMLFNSSWFRKKFVLIVFVWTLVYLPFAGYLTKVIHGLANRAVSVFGVNLI